MRVTVDNETLLREVCELLKEGRQVKIRAKGESMRPFIYDGDTIVLGPAAEYRKGDIVLAHVDDGRYVVHRIIGSTDSCLILMGDGNLYGKELCDRKNVFGRVGRVIRGGRAMNMLTNAYDLRAIGWRCLLPLRRLKQRIGKRIINA